jgi:hypothetical protein
MHAIGNDMIGHLIFRLKDLANRSVAASNGNNFEVVKRKRNSNYGRNYEDDEEDLEYDDIDALKIEKQEIELYIEQRTKRIYEINERRLYIIRK